MSCESRTVAACVFEGHRTAMHDCHECPLLQSLLRRPRVVASCGDDDAPGGGAVFSVGSITYPASLLVDNAVSRITANVLRRFLE